MLKGQSTEFIIRKLKCQERHPWLVKIYYTTVHCYTKAVQSRKSRAEKFLPEISSRACSEQHNR